MTDGTWWDHWADWMIARAGEERPRPQDPGQPAAPGAGARAPGIYVFEKV